MIRTEVVKNLASEVGFDLCGVEPCRHLAQNEEWFRRWLDRGMNASLGYLERNLDKRFDPRRLVEGARTAVVCAVGYKNRASEGYPAGCRTKIASYACAADYHATVRAMLARLFEELRGMWPGLRGRAFVDTAPLLEKQLAVEAGLGWIGRQSLLVTPRLGSFVVLGELILADEADRYDEPFEGTRCGRCRNCIESCPTGAIVAPRVVDAGRCIACHTIEREPASRIDLDGWIFGCDRCQSCCPYNRNAPMHAHPAFDPLFDPEAMTPEAWRTLGPGEFEARFGRTPLTRSGLERIRSNIAAEADAPEPGTLL